MLRMICLLTRTALLVCLLPILCAGASILLDVSCGERDYFSYQPGSVDCSGIGGTASASLSVPTPSFVEVSASAVAAYHAPDRPFAEADYSCTAQVTITNPNRSFSDTESCYGYFQACFDLTLNGVAGVQMFFGPLAIYYPQSCTTFDRQNSIQFVSGTQYSERLSLMASADPDGWFFVPYGSADARFSGISVFDIQGNLLTSVVVTVSLVPEPRLMVPLSILLMIGCLLRRHSIRR